MIIAFKLCRNILQKFVLLYDQTATDIQLSDKILVGKQYLDVSVKVESEEFAFGISSESTTTQLA